MLGNFFQTMRAYTSAHPFKTGAIVIVGYVLIALTIIVLHEIVGSIGQFIFGVILISALASLYFYIFYRYAKKRVNSGGNIDHD